MRRGLVVGKFMPLHRGHQLLIETALANVDELTVVVYNTDIDDYVQALMPANKRAGWIATLYPQIHNLVVLNDPLDGNYTEHDDPKYAQMYADQVAFLGPFTHVFSSEDYGAPFAGAFVKHGWIPQHITVDAARELMPISGTTFRSDMFKYRAFVDPIVYRSLIQKVVFVGTESTGKSTISAAMATEYDTMATMEYGRSLWEKYMQQGVQPDFHDLYKIATTQYEQEQAAALHSNRYLFCDTNAWTTMLWSEMYYGTSDTRIQELVANTKDEYVWFLCDDDFDWVDDGTRELGEKSKEFQTYHYKRLTDFDIEWTFITGDLGYRMQQVTKRLASAILWA
jgi:HTH-type transcriptional repressor of NAD biosynthesis genes